MWYYFSFANLNTPLIKKITLPYINHVQSIILVLINYLGSRVENVKQKWWGAVTWITKPCIWGLWLLFVLQLRARSVQCRDPAPGWSKWLCLVRWLDMVRSRSFRAAHMVSMCIFSTCHRPSPNLRFCFVGFLNI